MSSRAAAEFEVFKRRRKRLYIKISTMEREMGWKPSAHRAVVRNITKGRSDTMREMAVSELIRMEKAVAARLRAFRAGIRENEEG